MYAQVLGAMNFFDVPRGPVFALRARAIAAIDLSISAQRLQKLPPLIRAQPIQAEICVPLSVALLIIAPRIPSPPRQPPHHAADAFLAQKTRIRVRVTNA